MAASVGATSQCFSGIVSSRGCPRKQLFHSVSGNRPSYFVVSLPNVDTNLTYFQGFLVWVSFSQCCDKDNQSNVFTSLRLAVVGVEPPTLRIRTSPSADVSIRYCYLVRQAGLGPARLATPPPQDGVSTNSTTGA